MMILVIWWGVADVAYVLYERVFNHGGFKSEVQPMDYAVVAAP